MATPNDACFNMFSQTDIQMMYNALECARQGRFSTSPNPRVGCVIAQGEQIVGQGFHLKAGEPHAEVHALRQAGEWARGATAYVTLEPCSHYGRTPPCAEGLIAAGVKRVVAAMTDPNPLVAGRGLAMLRAAGITVAEGLMEHEARELNRGFLSRIERQRPFIRLKCAASLDGKTAFANGNSQWITSSAAREDVQVLRAESCAILTGVGTLLADNPQLTVRSFPILRSPTRVILDSQLRTPLHSHVVQHADAPTLLVTLITDPAHLAPYLAHAHIQILHPQATAQGQLDLADTLRLLAQQGLGEVMVEAGATLAGALLTQNLVDEIVLYQSAKILGNDARSLFQFAPSETILQQEPFWRTATVGLVGQDIKWTLRPSSSSFFFD